MKHVTYYLLVSISFPYIHTRQVGYDEGPQLLVVGELEQRHGALGVTHSTGATQTLASVYCGIPYSLHFIHIPLVCILNLRTVQLLVFCTIKLSSVSQEI